MSISASIFLDRVSGFQCQCGVTRQSRIVGGNQTSVNEFPWLAGISGPDEEIFCGSTLIASRWVVVGSGNGKVGSGGG